jgi:hypothetical protein
MESTIIKQSALAHVVEPLLSAGTDALMAALQSGDARTRAMALLIAELQAPEDERTAAARALAPPPQYRIVA